MARLLDELDEFLKKFTGLRQHQTPALTFEGHVTSHTQLYSICPLILCSLPPVSQPDMPLLLFLATNVKFINFLFSYPL